MTRLLRTLLPALLLAGCGPAMPSTNLTDVDRLYHWGDRRADLEAKLGKGTVVWVMESVPNDIFAAATLREIISLGKPRPAYYEIFLHRNFGPEGDYYRDYVFFSDLNRVMYYARRGPLTSGERK